MSEEKVHFNPDQYQIALQLATLLNDNYVATQDIKEVLEKTMLILKIKYPDIS